MTETQPAPDAKSGNHNSADVWKATEYPVSSFLAPANKPPAESPVEKRAIWIVHGMGQQVPFETLDSLTQGIVLGAGNAPNGWRIVGSARAASAKFVSSEDPSKTQVVQRVEIDLQSDSAKPGKLELHLYEAYWAPLTEGVAKLSDVMSFLFDGGLHGLLNSFRPFRRAMFPTKGNPASSCSFRIPFTSPLLIGLALSLVLALGVINAVIATASAARMKESFFGSWVGTTASLPQAISQHWHVLTAIATAITAIAFTFAAVLFLAEMSRPSAAPAAAKDAVARVIVGVESLLSYLAQRLSFFKQKNDRAARSTEAAEIETSGTNDARKRPGEAARGAVDSIWSFVIRLLSLTSLCATVAVILVGAACLTLIPWLSRLADWFTRSHFHFADWLGRILSDAAHWSQTMPYHATQFVSTAAILLAILLCAFAALRRAALRSIGIDHRSGGTPRFLFVSAFLLHIGLIGLLVYIQYHRYDPHAPIPWLLWAIAPETLAVWQQRIVNVLGSSFWVWPALIALSKLVRDLLVEYPGDVAIYVTSNKLDRFDQVRDKIKQVALDSLMPLYSACEVDSKGNPASFLYSKVAVVGHSLGSVIAYDTLNKLLTLDELLDRRFRVAERTAILETFGSPLDKTAFFFSFQGKDALRIREQLAASKQPLIESYACFRKFPWINVYSSSDIISGELKFYDVPGTPAPPAVQNLTDPAAIVPLIAHVEYWKNLTVWDKLLKEITR